MNISTSDGDLTTEDVETITETLESVISDSSNLQSIEVSWESTHCIYTIAAMSVEGFTYIGELVI